MEDGLTEIEKSLGKLAEEINAEHQACEEALRSGLRHAVRAGELLTEAKGQIKHGEWGRWVAENFEGSERTAQAYMRVWRELPKLKGANPQRVTDLSFRGALEELSAPLAPQEEAAGDEPHARRSVLQRFEGYMEFTETLVQIRDSGAWKESGHESFEAYLQARWNIAPALLTTAEEALNNPLERVRTMLLFELYDLVPGIELTPVGIEHIPEDLPFEVWRKVLDILNALAATHPDAE
jgi:Protein of unknown function (DUF3102)